MPTRRATSPARHSIIGEKRTQGLAQILELEKEQLRGVPIPSLLARAAHLYSRSGAAARERPKEVYALSQPVSRLDYFISHAWISSRLAKYCALCRFFNGTVAVHVALLASYLLFFWALFRPPVPDERMVKCANQLDKGLHTFPRAIVPWFVLPFGLFLITSATAHNLLCRKSTAFLDIACVNQLDPVAKAQGIERLGAVLARTEKMLVLADEHYWKRLWCVFEVAAFCRHADASRLVVLPLHSALTELGLVFFWFVMITLLVMLRTQSDSGTDATADAGNVRGYVQELVSIVLCLQPCILLPMMMGHRSRSALRQLRDFSIAESQCYSDEDRQALTAVIYSWYTDHQAGEDDPERLQALGRHKFETFVRHHLAPAIERQEAGDALRAGVTAAVCSILPYKFMILTANDSAMGHVGVTLLYLLTMAFALLPLIVFFYQLGTSATFKCITDILPRLSSPQTLLRKLLTVASYVLGLLSTAACFPFFALLMVPVRPNQFLAPAWRIPVDDGLDDETRRFAKHWVLFGAYVLGMIIAYARK